MRSAFFLLTIVSWAAVAQVGPPPPLPPSRDEMGAKVAPFVPSHSRVVEQMLELGKVGPGDYLIDLGSGDGQIVIEAAKRGAFGHGVELDSELIALSRSNAREAGVAAQTLFLQEDIFKADFSQATVVTLYLMPAANQRLRPLLLEKLRPGTRVVSNAFDMNEWTSDEYQIGSAGSGVYLWVIPADVAGEWRFTLGDEPGLLGISQEFQAISPRLEHRGARLTIEKALLRGRDLQLIASQGEQRYAFHGRVKGDRIEGYAQVGTGDGERLLQWRAERQATR